MSFKHFQPEFIRLDTVDSTNNYAAKLLHEGKARNGTTILTKRQTAGKGQRGAVWHSDTDSNLLMSIVMFPAFDVQQGFLLNIITSIAVQKSLKSLGVSSLVKWPNDIVVDHLKICGILIENQIQGSRIASSIIGIGLNVNQVEFDMDLKATSIKKAIGLESDVEGLALSILHHLDEGFDIIQRGRTEILWDDLHTLLYRKNIRAEYRCGDVRFFGIISHVDRDGKLVMKCDSGERKFFSKEISFV